MHVSATADDTHQLGRRLAAELVAGDLVVLTGPLGAGKTVFVQGIAAGLAVLGPVTSPTFVIARVHRPDPTRGGRLPLVHVDAYRLAGSADPLGDVDALDLDASLADSVTVVEWGEGLVEQLAGAYLHVCLDRRDDDSRVVIMNPQGTGRWPARPAGAGGADGAGRADGAGGLDAAAGSVG